MLRSHTNVRSHICAVTAVLFFFFMILIALCTFWIATPQYYYSAWAYDSWFMWLWIALILLICISSGTLTERVYVYRAIPSSPTDLEEGLLPEKEHLVRKQEKRPQQSTATQTDDKNVHADDQQILL